MNRDSSSSPGHLAVGHVLSDTAVSAISWFAAPGKPCIAIMIAIRRCGVP